MTTALAPTGHVPKWHEGRDLDVLAAFAIDTCDETLFAAATTARPEQAAATEARERLAVQDDDFCAVRITYDFHLDDPAEVEEIDDDEERRQIVDALAPWINRCARRSLIRADRLGLYFTGGREGCTATPTFFAVYPNDATALSSETIAKLSFARPELLPIAPNSNFAIIQRVQPVNASRLFEALRERGGMVGRWGGQPTPQLLPQPGEQRNAWLARVAIRIGTSL